MHYCLCDLFSDLVQNSVEAGANLISVEVIETDREIRFRVEDNGRGMTPAELARAIDPFYTDGSKHPGRKVGLGLPFLIQTAEQTGGSWNITSNKADDAKAPPGTAVECRFDLTNIDTPPVGDVSAFIRQILSFDGPYEMTVARASPRGRYAVRRSELLNAMGLSADGSFTDASSLALIKTYLDSMEE
jgi:hypothetical protein